ncbi:MAG: DUF5666 domain-containing protein [Glaciecola sp.]
MRFHKITLAIISSQLLYACGGGGDTSSNITPIPPSTAPTSPTVSTVIKTGVVTGFGSVYVDGQRFTTDNTSFTINGQAGQSIEQLKVGMKISMNVQESDENDTHSVSSVLYDNDIEGAVTAIDRNNQQLVIVGTIVKYNDLTHFIGLTEMSLSVDDRVEVSGYFDIDGTFIATYIELDDDLVNDNSEYTSGVVGNLDDAQQTFMLSDITVNYASSNTAIIENGQKVRVKGVLIDGVLTANEVEIIDESYYLELSNDDIARVEKEGLVTAFDSVNNTITIDGLIYQLAADVVIEGNTNIQVQDFVEIYLDPATNLVIYIETKDRHLNTDGKIKGAIEAIDSINQTITVNGQVYTFVSTTRLEDDDDKYFNFASLSVNDLVEVAYVKNSQSDNLIQRIEREDENEYNEEWDLESRVFTVDAATQTITLNGMNVTLTESMRFIINDVVTDLTTFLTTATDSVGNDEIEIEGAFDSTGEFVVQKVELEQQSLNGSNNDNDSDNDSDNDNDNHTSDNSHYNGYVEFEGKVTSIVDDSSFTLNNQAVKIDSNSELEINDRRVSVTQFMSALQVGVRLEIEGAWVNGDYIYAYEAEIESEDND